MKNRDYSWLLIIGAILTVLFCITLCILSVVALIMYHDTPINELPTWAWWILRRDGK